MPKTFEYRHIVSFEETNVVGNVYYVALLSWQGRCREMFLRENVPQVLTFFKEGFALVTTRVACEFLAELFAFDEIVVRMTLKSLVQNRFTMTFEYCRCSSGDEDMVAKGEQEIACMQRGSTGQTLPTPIPDYLRRILQTYLQ